MPSDRHNPEPRPEPDQAQYNPEYEEWCREFDSEELESINRLLNGDFDEH